MSELIIRKEDGQNSVEFDDCCVFADEIGKDGRAQLYLWYDLDFGDCPLWDVVEGTLGWSDEYRQPTLKINFHLSDALDFLIEDASLKNGAIDISQKPLLDSMRVELQQMIDVIDKLKFEPADPATDPEPPA